MLNPAVDALGVGGVTLDDIIARFLEESNCSVTSQECMNLLRQIFPAVSFTGTRKRKKKANEEKKVRVNLDWNPPREMRETTLDHFAEACTQGTAILTNIPWCSLLLRCEIISILAGILRWRRCTYMEVYGRRAGSSDRYGTDSAYNYRQDSPPARDNCRN